MTDFTTNISLSLGVYGGGPTEKWNDFIYGSDPWLGPQDMALSFEKWLSSNAVLSDALDKTFKKGIPLSVSMSAALDKELTKWLAETITGSETLSKELTKWLAQGLSVVDAIDKVLTKMVSNNVVGATDQTSILQKGIWSVLFPGATTDATDRSIPDYTEVTEVTTTWTSSVVASTTWTEL